MDSNIILASASPRRTALLQQIGMPHHVIVSHYDEIWDNTMSLEENITRFALEKALLVSKTLDNGYVIGADTIVVCDGVALGKPDSLAAARKTLCHLSGKTHQVMTALAIVDAQNPAKSWKSIETTDVSFKVLSDHELDWYLSTRESMDKAGAYGIQGYGALLVDKIEGCYFNVVGLPLNKVILGLQTLGVDFFGG